MKHSLVNNVIDAIQSAIGTEPAVLHEPSLVGNEWKYLKECLDSSYVSSIGKFVDRFEVDLAVFTGVRHAIAVVNGSAALHIALKLSGVNVGDEVLVPTLTFVATANAITYCGAEPHFVDIEARTLGIDVVKLRDYLSIQTKQVAGRCVNKSSGRTVRAVVPMHCFGHPVDLSGLINLAQEFNLVIVEDAAESLGSYYNGQHTGTFGLMSSLSFNGNKIVTTGGGGAILTNDSGLARHAKHLTTTAKTPHAWEYHHDEIGYNYRMPNINASLGCAQLEQLPRLISAKRALFERYKSTFAVVKGVKLIEEPMNCQSNYWLQALLLAEDQVDERDHILQATNESGIMTRPVWELMHRLPPYKDCQRMDLAQAKNLAARLINIPSSPNLIETES